MESRAYGRARRDCFGTLGICRHSCRNGWRTWPEGVKTDLASANHLPRFGVAKDAQQYVVSALTGWCGTCIDPRW